MGQPTPGGRPRMRVISSSHVGSVNRGRLLQLIFRDGPSSRADLARTLGVPRATVGAIVEPLLADGTLEDGPPSLDRVRVGKPSRPLWFAASAGMCGSVAILPGLIVTAIVNARGVVLDRREAAIPSGIATDDLDNWVLQQIAESFDARAGQFIGLGVSVPAWCDSATGEVLRCTPLPALEGTQLIGRLNARYGLQCVLEQDVRAFAAGEKWFGSCRTVRDFVAARIDLGVGAGIVLNGQLYRGIHGPAAQVGHICTDIGGQSCLCGMRGCWETIASVRWLKDEAARRGIPGGRRTSIGRLARRSQRGDRAAAGLLDQYADNLAVGLAAVYQLLAVPLFVLHGPVVEGGEMFRAKIQERMNARTLRLHSAGPVVSFSSLEDADLLGTAATVLSREYGLEL